MYIIQCDDDGLYILPFTRELYAVGEDQWLSIGMPRARHQLRRIHGEFGSGEYTFQ
jgi:hypothetical protein